MEEVSGSGNFSTAYKIKRSVVSASLLALATAFEIVSRHSPELKAEISGWEDSRLFSIGVWPMPEGPAITMKKEADGITYLGKGYKDPKLIVLFKNLDSAILPFTGQMGSHTAFAQHRAILHGNVGEGMQVSRAMVIVQKFLMPGLIFKKIFKNPPGLSFSELLLKARVMGTLAIGLIGNMSK
jgi:hypothetical protein